MTTETTGGLYQFMPYGAPELKENARRYLVRATIVGSAAWIVLFLLSLGSVQILKFIEA